MPVTTDEYKTLKDISEGVYKEKGSKFIAVAVPVCSPDEVKRNLENLRKSYHDARHHCYAYRIGPEPYEVRYHDDGEPSGTAGKPILGQIQSFDLTNVLVVVIRYFGGVKLGTGGLIQAYRAASREAISSGRIISRHWMSRITVHFNYDRMHDIMHLVKQEGLQPVSQHYDRDCTIVLEIRRNRTSDLVGKFAGLGSAEGIII